ncbi:ribonuclease Z [Thermoactinomyces mirandus]|uniref:Ribonuclease Z n=1 Tax=Thermoactinomyces mirandus TaxID=2756294 RepID=A0A7W2AR37_9BACL|nr:ribonuclease Z [Thermoactinomyces mirandus]MBA4601912.1 ribonuclease Z [Thermoactinomyces mirandus]
MQIYFLGTGAGVPSRERNVSSLALIMPEYHGQIWLFDCGEATQHKIWDSPVKLNKVERIFITHLHGDHIFGLPGILGSRSFQGTETPLVIYGPQGLKEFVNTALNTSRTYLRYPLEIIEIQDGTRLKVPFFSILVKKLDHGIPSYGYRLQEQDQPGRLNVEKLEKAGIFPGPHYKLLKQGKTITLPDGRTISGKEFIGPPKKGRTIAILGDTRTTDNSCLLAKECDLLVHEATFRAGQEQLAANYYHSTCTEAAAAAKKAGAKHLILNHISSRFQKDEYQDLLKEAQAIFPATQIASDGWSFTLS